MWPFKTRTKDVIEKAKLVERAKGFTEVAVDAIKRFDYSSAISYYEEAIPYLKEANETELMNSIQRLVSNLKRRSHPIKEGASWSSSQRNDEQEAYRINLQVKEKLKQL